MATITDRLGNTWAITTGAQVTRNGVVDPATNGTVTGLYWNHVFNKQDTAGTWSAYNAGAWPQTTDPRLATNGLVASPSGSTLNSTSGTIRDSVGRVWALNGSAQITINGVADTSTSSNLILYWDLVVFHSNSAGTWYTYNGTPGSYTQVAGDPRILSRTVTGLVASTSYNFRAFAANSAGSGPLSATATASTLAVPTTVGNAPAQAVAAGYTNPVLNSDFDSTSEMADNGSAVATAWYTGSPEGNRYSSLGDSTISNSILSLVTASVTFSASLSSARSNSAVISTPGAIQAPNTSGRYFHYGFFEAKMRFNSIRSGPGWPSFWGTSFDDGRTTDHLEIDFMESQGPFNTEGATNGFLWWFNGVNDPGAFGEFFGALNATGYPNWGTVLADSGVDKNGGWNIFSCLWTPTRLTFYWNSAARRDQGIADYQVASYPTTAALNGFISNDGARPTTANMTDAQANPRFYLILGANSTANVQYDWVRVWQ